MRTPVYCRRPECQTPGRNDGNAEMASGGPFHPQRELGDGEMVEGPVNDSAAFIGSKGVRAGSPQLLDEFGRQVWQGKIHGEPVMSLGMTTT
jgi:hypothetical protein